MGPHPNEMLEWVNPINPEKKKNNFPSLSTYLNPFSFCKIGFWRRGRREAGDPLTEGVSSGIERERESVTAPAMEQVFPHLERSEQVSRWSLKLRTF